MKRKPLNNQLAKLAYRILPAEQNTPQDNNCCSASDPYKSKVRQAKDGTVFVTYRCANCQAYHEMEI